MSASRNFSRPARIAAIAPYFWMAIFFLVPFLFILKISLSQTAIAQPPYAPVFDFALRRSARCRYHKVDVDQEIVTNSHGFHDEEYPREKAPGSRGLDTAWSAVSAICSVCWVAGTPSRRSARYSRPSRM